MALAVIDIGNSSLHLGVWSDKGVIDARRVDANDWTGLANALAGLRSNSHDAELVAAVIACVVPDALDPAEETVKRVLELDALTIGHHIPLPMALAVDRPESVGVDRVCAAAAAFERVPGFCAVIDFGTAVTIDLVDDAGVFQGGAILPGPRLQALALGTHAAALPVVAARFPEQPVGKDTTQAIRSGICYGLVGAVRGLVERFATQLNQWPYVIATGGDVEMMAEHCDFIDAAVTDLCLQGVGLAYVRHLNGQRRDG